MSDSIKASDLARELGISKDAVLKRIKRDGKYPGAFKDDRNAWRVPVDEVEELCVRLTLSMDAGESSTPVDESPSVDDQPAVHVDDSRSMDGDTGSTPSAPHESIDHAGPSMDTASTSVDDAGLVHVDDGPVSMDERLSSMDRADKAHGGPTAASTDERVDTSEDFAQMAVDHELDILRVKLASAEAQGDSFRRETDTLREALEDARGEVSHLRTVNERLSMAVTNEQVLRLGSSPQAEAIEAQPTDVAPEDDLPEPPAEDRRRGTHTSVTIRGSKRRGWLSRVFGAR